jgi:hypothetical protein
VAPRRDATGLLEYNLEPTPGPNQQLKKIKTTNVVVPNRLTRWLIHQIQSTFGQSKNTVANQQAVRRFVLNLTKGVICGGEQQKAEAVEKALFFATLPSPAAIRAQQASDDASHFTFFADARSEIAYHRDAPTC